MAIVAAKSSGGYTPHPEGQFSAVCVDVHDVGLVTVTFNGRTHQKHKVDIYFWCGEWKELDDGRRVPVTVRERFTLSLDERGRLRPFLESWRGRAFTEEEEKGFDLEQLIGAPAFVQVTHNESGGRVYANITTIMRLPKGMERLGIPTGYVRVKDRPPRDGDTQPAGAVPGLDRDVPPPDYDSSDDPDLPF